MSTYTHELTGDVTLKWNNKTFAGESVTIAIRFLIPPRIPIPEFGPVDIEILSVTPKHDVIFYCEDHSFGTVMLLVSRDEDISHFIDRVELDLMREQIWTDLYDGKNPAEVFEP